MRGRTGSNQYRSRGPSRLTESQAADRYKVAAAAAAFGAVAPSAKGSISVDTMLEVIVSGNDDESLKVLSKKNCPPALLALVVDVDPPGGRLRASVAEHPNTPPEALERLATDLSVSADVLRHPNATSAALRNAALTVGNLGAQINFTSAADLAGHINCPPEMFDYLYDLGVFGVRQSLAANTSTPPDMLVDLSEEKHHSIVAAANPSLPVDRILDVLNGWHPTSSTVLLNPSLPRDAVDDVIRYGRDDQRRSLSDNSGLDQETTFDLAVQFPMSNAAWRAANDPGCSPSVLNGCAVGARETRLAVARHPAATAPTLAMLSTDIDPRTRRAVAVHPNTAHWTLVEMTKDERKTVERDATGELNRRRDQA